MQIEFDNKYKLYLNEFNIYLDDYLTSLSKKSPENIRDAMSYALKNGGKRVRPVLCLATCDILSVSKDKALRFALAIEMIHSYSLVHDDLPAMDNDDYRRGKPSTHKVFGEAIGILAGDGLLNLAIECLSSFNSKKIDVDYVKALCNLFTLSGYDGMIGGQVLDLQCENNSCDDFDTLIKIYTDKCAKLLIAPLTCSSLLANGKFYDELYNYGLNVGICFQIIDDIMDVEGNIDSIGKTPNKDAKSGKLTSVKILGLEKAKELADCYYLKAVDAIKNIPNNNFLIDLAKNLLVRRS